MSDSSPRIPVVLFAYARPAHLARTLRGLREDGVPLIEAFADGPKGEADAPAVATVRAMLQAVDWCEMRITERAENRGLGRNILAGVTEIAARYDAFIVWEDDLTCVRGTYAWLGAALRHYRDDARVMSVTGWTHPRVTPADVGERPWFDGRAECWSWGTWSRTWVGMPEETAREKLAAAAKRGVGASTYGADLPAMAAEEQTKNLWAVRWVAHHLQHGGLCVRPPWSMVEHMGFDAAATNAAGGWDWANPPLRPAPAVPERWPEPMLHPQCARLWNKAMAAHRPRLARLRKLMPAFVRRAVRRLAGRGIYVGNFRSWEAARAASNGYESAAIREKALAATCAVRDGLAAWERDTVLFAEPRCNQPLLEALRQTAAAEGGRLEVVDFGGAFGSTWWQHRSWLGDLPSVRWSVVEQEHWVEAGRREFTAGPLRFYASLEECCAIEHPTAIVLSAVLPYLPAPHTLLAEIRQRGFRHIIIDRTGFVRRGRDRLTVQRVPASIYSASYPCWFFDRAALLRPFAEGWRIAAEWQTPDEADIDAEYRGVYLEARR